MSVEVTLPDGTRILAHGSLGGRVPAERRQPPDFALYLDPRWEDDPEVSWPYQLVDWPDFGLPADESGAFRAVVGLHQRAARGELVEVACYGGIGRTGTVLACLAVAAGVPGAEAVQWVRDHYHEAAVETPAQERFIDRFAETYQAE